ncbi:hypothetical protein HETIRDRAFT_168925 [Heterobasidion irregulare TC 32-1]|uniref:Uncharacterized protein n=1 Tax=Heterobasidion irregulare (strain TC 32-1) TaxID=747525 RepID=W4K8G2_HETIT|nr:uncharacterized protein HETIRDRAFT_168925 [Heterobasidion irregulare TC 32-1]ETW82122.1 hypothetical protein HETIRDRAFT_168925 [Heterobasidion irregulare TC 32-1]
MQVHHRHVQGGAIALADSAHRTRLEHAWTNAILLAFQSEPMCTCPSEAAHRGIYTQ